MNLLQQIQLEAVDGSGDISSLLRRCRILAQRLGLSEFKVWVNRELEGYPSLKRLPPYRVVKTPLVLGMFFGPFGSRIENAQIPLSRVPEKLRKQLLTVRFSQGVGGIAEIIESTSKFIRIPWPADALRLVDNGDIYDGYYLNQAVITVPVASVKDILDQVRNRILNFCLEIESRNPDAGESLVNPNSLPPDQVRNIFNMVIKGDVQNLAQASESFSQVSNSKVSVGDFECLKNELSKAGVKKEDIEVLQVAIKDDTVDGKQQMGGRVKEWLGGVLMKAGDGLLNVTSSVASSLITSALKGYFGLPE